MLCNDSANTAQKENGDIFSPCRHSPSEQCSKLVNHFFLPYWQTCSMEQCLHCTTNPFAPIPTLQPTSMHPVTSIQTWQIAALNVVWLFIMSMGFLAIILVKFLIGMVPVSLHFIRIAILVQT